MRTAIYAVDEEEGGRWNDLLLVPWEGWANGHCACFPRFAIRVTQSMCSWIPVMESCANSVRNAENNVEKSLENAGWTAMSRRLWKSAHVSMGF